MKINTILLVGFLLLTTLIISIGYLPVFQTQKVLDPLSTNVDIGLSNTFEIVSYSDEPNKMLYYEEAATNSIKLYTYTNDKTWLERYNSFEPLLDLSIKSGIQSGDFRDREYLAVLNTLLKEAKEIENEIILLMAMEKQEDAINIIESKEYLDLKNLVKGELTNYVLRREGIYQNAIEESRNELSTIIEGAKIILEATSQQVFLLTILTILIAVGLGNLIYYAVSRPLRELSKTIEEITQGNLDVHLKPSDVDEIQSLIYSLDRILASLKLAIISKGVSKESLNLGEPKVVSSKDSQKKQTIAKGIC
jgi:methyl-accepting chemotaxis protein